jgi:hypothetical protein
MSDHLITLAEANALRERRYHRKLDLRLTSQQDIRAFVDEVGACLLFPAKGIEMPNVYQAVAGKVRATTSSHHDPVIGLTWGTKDAALDKHWWYYGKLIRDKATLLSLDLLPAFYALSENYGSPEDYLDEYEAGRLSADARSIYEALLKQGPLHAINLKRATNLYGDAVKGKFDKAIAELQRGLKILPVGVAEAGAWRYAFIYELLWRWFPDVSEQARTLTRGEARSVILERHLRNVIYTTPKEASRLFGWRPEETTSAIQRLVAHGIAATGRVIKGLKDEVVLLQPLG